MIRSKCARKFMLSEVLQWNPEWLKESLPPFLHIKEFKPTSLSYKTYEDYVKVMIPLLLLEFWYEMKSDFNNEIVKKKIKGVIHSCNSLSNLSCNDSKELKILYFNLVLTLDLKNLPMEYPSAGDLVFLSRPNVEKKILAYVQNLRVKKIQQFFNESVELTYTLATNSIIFCLSEQPFEITTVTIISSFLGLFDSLVNLKISPLKNFILQPNVAECELSPLNSVNFPPLLITEDKLNTSQLQVIARIKETVKEKKPKLCFIHGPPGTGKSHVIVNTVASLFVKENITRILVCACSNQAIDEITLRLLEIQKIFSVNECDFKIVRVGRENKMNEFVRNITPSALAIEEMNKFDVRITAGVQSDFQQEILKNANVIVCTLASCTTLQMTNIFGHDGLPIRVCLIDEAAQATEMLTLAPLILGVNKLFLIGDPKQLRPVVLSQKAVELGLDVSLFSRIEKISIRDQTRSPIVMLDEQYRMLPSIAHWPNHYFYHGTIQNGPITLPWLKIVQYKLFHHQSSQDSDIYSNTGEANLVVNLVYIIMMHSNAKNSGDPIKIGIITPYRKQRNLIIELMKKRFVDVPEEILNKVPIPDVNTVDSYQGSERDIIIMSCVRSAGIGFLNDPNRLCVSVTRAKHSMIICGNFNTFYKNAMWKSLLTDAKSRGFYKRIKHDVDINQLKKHVIFDDHKNKK